LGYYSIAKPKMKICIYTILYFIFPFSSYCKGNPDSLINQLKIEINKKRVYDQQKETKISLLRSQLITVAASQTEERYSLYNQIYQEYKDYTFDSAHVYTQRLLRMAVSLNSLHKRYDSQIKLAIIQVSCGMFKEAFDGIEKMHADSMDNDLKFRYYELKSQAYIRLSLYNRNKFYSPSHLAEARAALHFAINLAAPGSYEKLCYTASNFRDSKQFSKAISTYQSILAQPTISDHQRAMTLHDLSSLRPLPERKRLLTLAAIYDIRSSTKETLAISSLANILMAEGNIADAEILLNEALSQTKHYGNTLQQKEVLTALEGIAAQKLIRLHINQNNTLTILIIILAIAIVLTGVTFFFVYRKLSDVRKREAIVNSQNYKLDGLNKELFQLNKKLSEDSSIKEEYIGQFFSIISAYIAKLEKIKRSSEKTIRNENFKELSELAKAINIKDERMALFHTFDTIFLKLYPNFIASFNALLAEEDKIVPKRNEILNTNLRIFALIRLGIKDNQVIANILESKVTTIYTYKFRIRSRALVQGDEFDKKVMEIKFSNLEQPAPAL
jgi:hypothetical protein